MDGGHPYRNRKRIEELRELVESRHEWRAFIHRVTKSREEERLIG